MFIRQKKSPHNKNKISVQIVESIRSGDAVSQTILRHVGTAENEEELQKLLELAEAIKIRLEEERMPSLPLFLPDRVIKIPEVVDDKPLPVNLKNIREECRFNEGIVDVFGKLYDDLKFNTLFKGRFADINNAILKSCVLARLANPSSKYRTSELLEQDFAIKLPVDKIYRMMTNLEEMSADVKNIIRSSTLTLLNNNVNILFFDVTTLYFESFTEDELRSFGFSKDCKFKETQIVFSLITTRDGLPITYQVFPGKTQEMQTLIPVLQSLKKEYNINEINFAADRGMFCSKNLDLLEAEKTKYVVAAKLKSMDKKTKEEILSINHNNEKNSFQLKEIEYDGRRLVVMYCPLRAQKDKKDRERLLERMNKKLDSDGKVEVSKLINNNGTKKYLKFDKSNKKTASLNEDKIKLEEQWDGIAGYVTNSTDPALEVISNYRRLWEIEESFRINKHDLKVRPIFHHDSKKIMAHMDICLLAYALARQLMYRFEVQQKSNISFEQIRNALLQTQASVLVDKETKKKYILPSKATPLSNKLYQIIGIKRSLTPYLFTGAGQ